MELMITSRTNPRGPIPGPTEPALLRALTGPGAGAKASELERTTPSGVGAGDVKA
ncbi:hypothetical protein F2Q70_00033219 [Brassica cretica]|uniref:Uncharacterized protein n=1 Tax=Brassica cretica TaxID=69181 RepID=A0A8S9FDU1_BRACR|nr:hypothetical protein F2Q70_00033219 [Brassica cretica]